MNRQSASKRPCEKCSEKNRKCNEGKKKALLIGIEYGERGSTKSHPVKFRGAHNDCNDMSKFLRERYGFKSENITILLDSTAKAKNETKSHLQPTRENILREISKLVNGATPDDQFLFHYSGHGYRISSYSDGPSEPDGMDEAIVPCDAVPIKEGGYVPETLVLDNELHEILVKRLPIGAKLTAIFDTCHSGSALDLMHYDRVKPPPRSTSPKRIEKARDIDKPPIEVSPVEPPAEIGSRMQVRGGKTTIGPEIISISSCSDGPPIFEAPKRLSVTQILMEVLKNQAHPTYKNLMEKMNGSFLNQAQDLHNFYAYRKKYREGRNLWGALKNINAKTMNVNLLASIIESAKNKDEDDWEEYVTNNKPVWEPQLGSQKTLDLNDRFCL